MEASALLARGGAPAEPIRVFCLANRAMMDIEYPTGLNGWSYRSDLCGPSMHRWDFGDLFVLCGRHSTCGNAVFPRARKCRNCQNKNWRLSCNEPCESFFLSVLVDTPDATRALQSLVSRMEPATDEEAAAYMRCLPKANFLRKSTSFSAIQDAKKLERLVRSEQKFRASIRSKSADDLSELKVNDDLSLFLQQMADENLVDMLAPTSELSVDVGYERMLELFSSRWDDGVWMAPDDLRISFAGGRASTVVPSEAFAGLCARIVERECVASRAHLFILPSKLEEWLGYLTTRSRIVFGFYVPMHYHEYRSIYLGQEPTFEHAATRLVPHYATALARLGCSNARPVFVACYDGPSVTTEAILPLGVLCED